MPRIYLPRVGSPFQDFTLSQQQQTLTDNRQLKTAPNVIP
jgi:hypothetical protein